MLKHIFGPKLEIYANSVGLCYTEKCVLDGSLSTLFIYVSVGVFGLQFMSWGEKEVLFISLPNKCFLL